MISRGYLQAAARLLSAALLLALAACGSAPPRQPLALEQARKAEQAAYRALRDGDLMRAREMFRQSMLMQQALDNIAASAMAAVNLSSVSHKLGDDAAALGLLDGILADSTAQIPAELRAAAAFRKAIILADAGKFAEAEAALLVANQECKQCAFVPGMNNLSARLALQKGDFPAALALAKGVTSSGAEKDEQANAQRIAARAEIALAQPEAALAHFQAALALDKELALSSRIAEDLQGMAIALDRLGRKPEAETFARRAESVAAAAQMLPGGVAKKPLP
jgi:tetratricopeptide (TPR) repeat protein